MFEVGSNYEISLLEQTPNGWDVSCSVSKVVAIDGPLILLEGGALDGSILNTNSYSFQGARKVEISPEHEKLYDQFK